VSKLKPKWVKTDIPKDTKIKLWRIMRDNPTYDSWSEGIANLQYGLDEKDDKYVKTSRDTYKSLQEEIRKMPISEVLLLPADLRVWVQELRPDTQCKSEVGTTEQDSLVLEARKKHYQDLLQLLQRWKEELVFEVRGFLGKYETVFPTSFKAEDACLDSASGNYWVKGPLHWYIDKDGAVDVWFSVEELALFRCLKPHLSNQKLWQSFEELKGKLAEGIKQASLTQARRGVFVHDALWLASVVADELEIAIAKRWFAGRCEACPEV